MGRAYEMRKRAEGVAHTRRRIIDATVHLHTTVGPAKTTISRIAEVAGVTRVTVYKHFADEVALFTACSAQWFATNPPPDMTRWAEITEGDERLPRIVDDMYGWFAAHANDLRLLHRDRDAMPPAIIEANEAFGAAVVDIIADGAGGDFRIAASHLLSFPAWDSLTTGGQIGRRRAVDLAVGMLRGLR